MAFFRIGQDSLVDIIQIPSFPMFEGLTNINEIITFLIVGGIVQVLFIFNFFYSIFYGTKASKNPWGSTTLEWTTPIEEFMEIGWRNSDS